ncbi:MAG: preprotein translocase subunit SecE [Deltaproteobacteria bacterium]|nr:preprotein translocase subunit SecE [Deltaproteobacteria bacterium]
MGNNKWVHLTFVGLFLVLAFLLVRTTDWVWGYFAKPKDLYLVPPALLVAGVVSFMAWRNQVWFTRASEIILELAKVTWPTRKETSAATLVVIVTVIVFSLILGLFDLFWSWATGIVYS